jgi:hypothetical protein
MFPKIEGKIYHQQVQRRSTDVFHSNYKFKMLKSSKQVSKKIINSRKRNSDETASKAQTSGKERKSKVLG